VKAYRIFLVLFLAGLYGVAGAFAQERAREAIRNWPAPPLWLSSAGSGGDADRTTGIRAEAVTPFPLPFVPVTPCRIADTRGNGFSGAYGPPSIGANTSRSFTITGQCGIPQSAFVVSFNFTALNVSGAGDLRVFPTGSSVPLVSTLNYNASTPNIANAAVVPLGSLGNVTAQADATTIDLVIDVNGYYGSPTTGGVFVGPLAGNSTMSGSFNVGVGLSALNDLTSGDHNTAMGAFTLEFNTTGVSNTALGAQAGESNRGSYNTAVGASALFNNNAGDQNVAIGRGALSSIGTSLDNIALGDLAASNLTSGSHNIHIGNPALSSESNTIRIGAGGTHTKFFVAGVRDVMTAQANAVPVVIDGNAQLGTLSSSARVKREVADIGEESSALLKLRPVSFFYRNDTVGYRQYGLIAEEVAEVMPELVQYSAAGEPQMVRWHFLPPLLLNEIQKQQATIAQQNAVIAGLEARLARLEALLSAESGR
jgi:hypothetical protein